MFQAIFNSNYLVTICDNLESVCSDPNEQHYNTEYCTNNNLSTSTSKIRFTIVVI